MCHFHQLMKTGKILKERDLNVQFEELLRGLFSRVPFLKLEKIRRETRIPGSPNASADFLFEVRTGKRRSILVAEAKRVGQPREVRTALLQLEKYLASLPGRTRYHGVFLAPFISEESGRLCTEAGISYADLAGNARLSFDHVFIETHAADNPFREKREKRSLFAPKATRVLRVLLQGPLRP